MKITLILCTLIFSLSSRAGTLFDQLCAFNPNWRNHHCAVPTESERVFLSDKQYIQTHLELVLKVLKSADVSHLSQEQLVMRKQLTEVLSDYCLQGVFPINYYVSARIPVFIDEHNTHCAVGYLMRESGFENLAQSISKTDNYIWVKDLKGEEVLKWQQLSGFSLEELKLIQGAYDFYMPFALEAPNRIEIPQKPEVIAMGFQEKDLKKSQVKTGKNTFWIRGEGYAGVLNGRWEQNYSPTLPWIVGFYQSGKREGKWLEYYRGTDKLCRTEHWKNDQLNGIRTRFDREGNVIEEILFENGNAVLKTNYDLILQLKYVRKIVGENKVWTEVYETCGRMIASGHEMIYNPGNLQWFQNIELTALNTMSLASQTYSPGNSENSPRLFEEPPLVEYIKQGDWVFKIDSSNDYPDARYNQNNSSIVLFTKRFWRFGNDLNFKTQNFGGETNIPEFDSLHVSFTDGDINSFDGFFGKRRFRMELERYSAEELSSFRNYSIPLRIDPYGREQRYYTRFGSDVLYPDRSYHSGAVLKSIGFVNEKDEKIKKWQYYNQYGQLERIEEYILPKKKDIGLNEDQKR